MQDFATPETSDFTRSGVFHNQVGRLSIVSWAVRAFFDLIGTSRRRDTTRGTCVVYCINQLSQSAELFAIKV